MCQISDLWPWNRFYTQCRVGSSTHFQILHPHCRKSMTSSTSACVWSTSTFSAVLLQSVENILRMHRDRLSSHLLVYAELLLQSADDHWHVFLSHLHHIDGEHKMPVKVCLYLCPLNTSTLYINYVFSAVSSAGINSWSTEKLVRGQNVDSVAPFVCQSCVGERCTWRFLFRHLENSKICLSRLSILPQWTV